MNSSTITFIAAFATTLVAQATPSSNNFCSVTNDWRSGCYSNVLELALERLQANSNDIVAAYIIKDYDINFSDLNAMSNSFQRLIRCGELVELPAYTNKFPRLRLGYQRYLDIVIPSVDDAFRLQEQQNPIIGKPMNSEHLLKLFSDNGLW